MTTADFAAFALMQRRIRAVVARFGRRLPLAPGVTWFDVADGQTLVDVPVTQLTQRFPSWGSSWHRLAFEGTFGEGEFPVADPWRGDENGRVFDGLPAEVWAVPAELAGWVYETERFFRVTMASWPVSESWVYLTPTRGLFDGLTRACNEWVGSEAWSAYESVARGVK